MPSVSRPYRVPVPQVGGRQGNAPAASCTEAGPRVPAESGITTRASRPVLHWVSECQRSSKTRPNSARWFQVIVYNPNWRKADARFPAASTMRRRETHWRRRRPPRLGTRERGPDHEADRFCVISRPREPAPRRPPAHPPTPPITTTRTPGDDRKPNADDVDRSGLRPVENSSGRQELPHFGDQLMAGVGVVYRRCWVRAGS